MKLLSFVLVFFVFNFTQSANSIVIDESSDNQSICDYASTKAWIQISNNVSQSKTLYFGFDLIYSTCFLLDSFQIELPPPPPANIFYSNFNFKCNTSEKLFECDYKQYINQTQVDTYKIKIQSGDTGFPIKVHWSKANIQSICDSAILREIGGTQIVNMTSIDSLIITDDFISSIRIIRYGAKLNPVGIVSNPPPVPTLLSPPNNIQNIPPQVKFIWNSSTGAEFYRLQIWQREWWGTFLLFDDSTLTDTTFQIDTLKFNKEYDWCVSARNDSGSSAFSQKWRFKTYINDAPKIVIPLKARNNVNDTMTVHFGVAVGATYCIDEEFGEFEVPPKPNIEIFYIRFIDNRTGYGRCLGEGTFLNLQGWEKYIKRDTFKVEFQPGGGGFPLKFSWPNNLNEFYDELIIRAGSTTVINMLTDSLVIIDNYAWPFRIFGIPKPYATPDPPVLLSPTNGSAIYGSLNLEWKQTLRAHRYWLQVSTDSNFTTTIINDSTIKTNTYQTTGGLEPFVWHYWRVGAINSEGFSGFSDKWSFILSPCSADEDRLIKNYSLSQNYPNPFNPVTTIKFSIHRSGFVTLKIFNILGKEIQTLVSEFINAGTHKVNWNATGFSSGIYYYSINATSMNDPKNTFTQYRKMILLR